jgi:hypothetical protein
MKAVREAGGLTGDSFAAKVGDKLTMHGVTTTVDADHNVTAVDITASKNSVRSYELVVDGDPVDWKALFDELRLPENRIHITSENRAVVQLHDFQTGELAEVLDRQHRNYSLNKQEQIAALGEEEAETITIDGHESVGVFYSVQIDQATVHEMVPLLQSLGFDTTKAVTMRNVGRGCWFAFTRENIARDVADLVRQNGHACAVVAINRHGQSIVTGGDSDIRVVDTHEHVEIGPRPWNDRATEYAAMTDEERAEVNKTVQANEYLIAVDKNERFHTIVYITPESYFRETGEMWQGEMIFDMLPDERKAGVKLLTPLSPGVYKGGLEANLMKDNLCRWGMVESLLLRIHLNELMSDERIAHSL